MNKTFIKKIPFKMLSNSPIAGTFSCKSIVADGSSSSPYGITIKPNDEQTYITINGVKIKNEFYTANDGDDIVIHGKYRVTSIGTVLQYCKETVDISAIEWFISLEGSLKLHAFNVKGNIEKLYRLTNVKEFVCHTKNIEGSVEGLAKAMVNNGRKSGSFSVYGENKSGITVNGSTDFYSCSVEFSETYNTGYNITVKKTKGL